MGCEQGRSGGDVEIFSNILPVAGPLLGALIGGSFALLGTWLSDRRKLQNEHEAMRRRERALLTGMFAVRNHIGTRLQEYDADGLLSRLKPLRTAQAYVHRLIDKAPGESEGLMIAVIELGLKLDALLVTIEAPPLAVLAKPDSDWIIRLRTELDELMASLEQLDVFTGSSLDFIDGETLAGFRQVEED